MENIKFYLENLDKNKMVTDLMSYENMADRFSKAKRVVFEDFKTEFKAELSKFFDECKNIVPAKINRLDRHMLFAYSKENGDIDIMILYEKELLKKQEQAMKYVISGLTKEEIVSLYVIDIPFTLNHIFQIMSYVLFNIYKQTESYQNYMQIEHDATHIIIGHPLQMEHKIPEKLDNHKEDLKKQIYRLKREYNVYSCNVETGKAFSKLLEVPTN